MDCPRCGGSVDAYTLGDSRAAVCDGCGWVGVDASLGGDGDTGPSESWEEALDRSSGRPDTVTRDGTGLPPTVAGDEAGSAGDAETGESDTTRDEGGSAGEGTPLDALEGVDAAGVEQLEAAGVRTVEELARAEPADLAAETDLSEARLRSHVRNAAIQHVTGRESN